MFLKRHIMNAKRRTDIWALQDDHIKIGVNHSHSTNAGNNEQQYCVDLLSVVRPMLITGTSPKTRELTQGVDMKNEQRKKY